MILLEYVKEYKEQLQYRLDNPTYFSGLPLWHPELDKSIRGLRTQEVTALTGGTATGKSSFALRTVAMNMLHRKIKFDSEAVLYVSAEMPTRKVVNRLVSILTGVPGILLDTGEFIDPCPVWEVDGRRIRETRQDLSTVLDDISWALAELATWPLDIQDMSLPTTMHVTTWIKNHHADNRHVPIVVIDHIGKLSDAPPVDNATMIHQSKLNSIMGLAREMDTHVMLIHDLDKAGTQKETPDITNLKGGSASQYDFDNAIIIKSEDGRKGEKTVFFHLEKNRHGAGYTGRYGPTAFAQPAGMYGIDIESSDIVRKYREYGR